MSANRCSSFLGCTFSTIFSIALLACRACDVARADEQIPKIVNWGKVERISRTTATLQVGANPLLRRGNRVSRNAFNALQELGADYVRYISACNGENRRLSLA